jgi:hypothetical protein
VLHAYTDLLYRLTVRAQMSVDEIEDSKRRTSPLVCFLRHRTTDLLAINPENITQPCERGVIEFDSAAFCLTPQNVSSRSRVFFDRRSGGAGALLAQFLRSSELQKPGMLLPPAVAEGANHFSVKRSKRPMRKLCSRPLADLAVRNGLDASG